MKPVNFNSPLSIAVFISLISIINAGCSNKRETLTPFGWTPTYNHSDTLLMQADRALMSYADPRILDSLVNEYCIISEREDPKNIYEHRRLYWKGNVRFMQGDYEQGDSLRRMALELCDSSAFPRDYRLYRMAVEQPSDFTDNASRYRRYKEDLNVFREYGDMVSSFTRAVQLSGLMSESGMTKEALEYAVLSDSLLADAGLTVLRTNNRVNIAAAYAAVGDTLKAVSELRALRDSVQSYSIPSIAAIVDYNLFQLSGDTISLYKAWKTVAQFEELTKMRPLVASSIINSGNLNIADMKELQESLNLSSEFDYSPEETLEISHAKLMDAKLTGNIGRINEASDEYIDAVNDYKEAQHKGEVIAAQTSGEIREVEERERLIRESIRTKIGIFTTVGLLILVFLGIMVYRYVERHKRNALLNQLETERLSRDIIAKELMLVEKQKLNDNLQHKIENLVREKKVEKMTADTLSMIIESASVKSQVDSEDSEFLKAFINKYPKVSKTGRKIALLIWKGFDTADIAREMNIRKESVIQARWRLRTQMGLSNDNDLDVILRKS